MVVALFCGDTVASEASWGSLRYLLAIPVPRARLLGVKLIVALLYSALALLLLAGTALLAGTLRYGWAAAAQHDRRRARSPARALLRLLGDPRLPGGHPAGRGRRWRSCSRCRPTPPLGAVGGAVLLLILSSILDQITALGAIRDFLPTHYSDAWLGLLSTPVQTDDMVKGCISAICYATLFWALAFWRFTRKDITS